MADRMKVDVDIRGEFWDGRAVPMLLATTDDVEDDVGERADTLVSIRLGHVLKNPTGRFESTVRAFRRGGDVFVPGEGTVYGRWLEGESSRNATTRFKGYATFRRVGVQTDREAGRIAERHIDRLGRRLS